MASKEEMTEVPTEDADNYCKILTLLGMEEEGDPVARVAELVAMEMRQKDRDSHPAHSCMATDSPSLVDEAKQGAENARESDFVMRYWQHGETGRLCAMETSPSPRYYEITGDQYEAATTGSRSEPPTPDRRTGPPDRRLVAVECPLHHRRWFGFGRRSTDKP